MKKFWAIFLTRNLEFLRDRGSLAWSFLFPFLMIFGFAFAFSDNARPLYKVGVIGDLQSAASESDFFSVPHVQWVSFADDQTLQTRIRHHQLDLGVDLLNHRYWINTSSPTGAIAERILTTATGSRFERQTLEGRQVRYVDWVFPGVLAMNMMFGALFGVGYVIVRYRKNGVLKRLKATPLSAMTFLSAQVVSRLFLILLMNGLVFAGCYFTVRFQMLGSFLNLFLVYVVGAFCMISMGLLISARTASEELAGGLLNLLSWPMMFGSGVWFSLEGTRPWMQRAAQFLPLTHIVDASRAIMTEGAGFSEVLPHIGLLMALSLVFLVAGAFLFRWE